jgi:hypothetical protein
MRAVAASGERMALEWTATAARREAAAKRAIRGCSAG